MNCCLSNITFYDFNEETIVSHQNAHLYVGFCPNCISSFDKYNKTVKVILVNQKSHFFFKYNINITGDDHFWN